MAATSASSTILGPRSAPKAQRGGRRHPVVRASREVRVSVPPPAPPAAISAAPPRLIGTPLLPALAAALAAAGAAAAYRMRAESAERALHYPGMVGLVRPGKTEAAASTDPEYRLALARTRQANAVLRALGFLQAGSRSRAAREVRRALHEHSITGEGLVGSAHGVEQRAALCTLLLEESAGLPRDNSLLLRLSSLLGLDFEQAEELQRQVAASLAQAQQQPSAEEPEQQRARSQVLPLPTTMRRPLPSAASQ